MKHLYFVSIALLFFCCQCATSKYDVFKVESIDAEKDEEGKWISERPYLRVEYDYWANGGVVWMRLTNTGDSDLWIYIEESAMEINGKSLPHMSSAEVLMALRDRNFFPQPKVNLSPKESYILESYPIQPDRWKYKGEKPPLYFTRSSSPLVIRSKWTIGKTNTDQQFSIYDEFYVSSVERLDRQDFKVQSNWLASESHFFIYKDYRPLWVELAAELAALSLLLLL